ncbi:MAG TPA: glycosyltransferase family 4 protein [Cyclobacteriaceae bacterium]|nr:glycosyltransferase family 4 protein [Cyclobacteriaceae bacterium]
MNEIIRYSITGIILIALELLYFKIADHFNIIDKPNQRSSHSIPTIRGGGIVFLFAILLWFVMNNFTYPWFVLGAFLIAVVSFMDDLGEQPAKLRLTIQLLAFLLMGWEAGLNDQPIWISMIMLIVGVGTINAFNFMDGINGITGIYSLVNMFTFLIINRSLVNFTNENLLISSTLGVLVFLFYNFRKKARCFAGDIGSVTIAFIQLFLLIQLIQSTGNYGWIFLFLIYGTDSVITIVYRLTRRENIFKAHRSHLYQYFSNELGVSHLTVSLIYGALQLVINILLFLFLVTSSIWFSLILMLIVGIVYLIIREKTLKKIGIKGLIVR